ncbi:MAG: HDIG domain-containing metalloprotein [Candidatus Omnitrophota bacterium]
MIKQTVIFRVKFAAAALALILFAGACGLNLSVPLFLLVLYAYLKFSRASNARTLYIVFLFAISFALCYFILSQGWPIFYLPFCLIPMLAALLFEGVEVPLVLTLSLSVSVGALAGSHFNLALLMLISGIGSSILVTGARRRSCVIRAGFLIGIIQIISLLAIERFVITQPSRYAIIFSNSIVSSFLVLGALPVFEYLFGTATNISLLECADFNHPLLQRMIMAAPGTYHHSLVVGNLSDAASRAVGANGLLARIGAYYHDIGKIEKAEYFSENQSAEVSKHSTLSPSMSKMVIMHHVKVGVDLAKKHKLNPRLIDFIQQHHGKALVYYFYHRALEGLEEDEEVREEGFRYPGPKPNSKETAIVLLADSVEAATRALREPDPAKIEEVAHKVINNKFIDGQLDECDLTLRDLEKISKVFIHILSGIYHSRISYP